MKHSILITKIYPRVNLRYFGTFIPSDEENEKDFFYRIEIGWLKWRNALRMLCNNRISSLKQNLRLKIGRLAAIKHVQKMSITEMRMLRWMVTILSKIESRMGAFVNSWMW